MNAAGVIIPSGGFDSLVALFSHPPTSASILMSGGNSIASDPATTQFFPGCPPAGTDAVGIESICGDNTRTATLAAGSYTLLLTDGGYEPFAFNPGDPSPLDLTSAAVTPISRLAFSRRATIRGTVFSLAATSLSISFCSVVDSRA